MRVANRVVFNTGILYAKMLVTIGLTLYSTRFVLAALGISDYGVYNLVAGVVTMLSFLNTAMAISTQRYLSYHMAGPDGPARVKQIFISSVWLHVFIGLIIVVFLELGGIYLFNNLLSIPPARIHAAKLVFQFMVLSTFFTVNAVPYDAAIIAHENMVFDAITGIFEAVLKFAIAFGLAYMTGDRLILYGALIAVLTIVLRIIKSTYCARHYPECRFSYFNFSYDKQTFRDIFSFAGWNTLGAIMLVGSTQGIAIVLNLFFGTLVNAGYGIAYQVNSQINAFSSNMLKALNPQIIKSEGQGNRERMLSLSMTASKFSFFLLGLFTIPLIIEMPYVLQLWLKQVPPYALIFCKLILVVSLINQLSSGIMTSMQSVGKIKWYTTTISILMLLNIPVSYFFLKMGYRPEAVLIVAIVIEVAALLTRVFFAKKYTGMPAGPYFVQVVGRAAMSLAIAAGAASFIPRMITHESFLRLCLTVIVFLAAYAATLLLIGLSRNDKEKLQSITAAVSGKMRQKIKFAK
jgi:O-antigen/teichoic acid export membrane protein